MPKDLEGRKFGNYVLIERLGTGGMGAVYLGEHPQIGRKVAIKVISKELAAEDNQAARFIREAKAIVGINHPNVIDVFDFGQTDDGYLYTVMEHLEGKDLASVMRKRVFDANEIWAYLEQICHGLQAAHDQHIIHRDLKPANIFVLDGEKPQIKLLDFGLAKVLKPTDGDEAVLTQAGVVFGTPLYMAPEQATGDSKYIGPTTDIYALGVVIYEMLVGRPPFSASDFGVLLAKHITQDPPPLQQWGISIPAAIRRVVHLCLEKDPQDRPQGATALAKAYEVALATNEVETSAAPDSAGDAAISFGETLASHGQALAAPGPQPETPTHFLTQRPLDTTQAPIYAPTDQEQSSAERSRRGTPLAVAIVLAGVFALGGYWVLKRNSDSQHMPQYDAAKGPRNVSPADATTTPRQNRDLPRGNVEIDGSNKRALNTVDSGPPTLDTRVQRPARIRRSKRGKQAVSGPKRRHKKLKDRANGGNRQPAAKVKRTKTTEPPPKAAKKEPTNKTRNLLKDHGDGTMDMPFR